MNCSNVHDLLHPFADGELDIVRHIEFEEHLKQCESCAAEVRQLQTLRETIAAASLGYRAPAALREKIRSAVVVPLAATTDRAQTPLAAIEDDDARSFNLPPSQPGCCFSLAARR